MTCIAKWAHCSSSPGSGNVRSASSFALRFSKRLGNLLLLRMPRRLIIHLHQRFVAMYTTYSFALGAFSFGVGILFAVLSGVVLSHPMRHRHVGQNAAPLAGRILDNVSAWIEHLDSRPGLLGSLTNLVRRNGLSTQHRRDQPRYLNRYTASHACK